TVVYTLFVDGYGAHRDLHSFPTRRSSDLGIVGRLKPGITVQAAETALLLWAKNLTRTAPDDDKAVSVLFESRATTIPLSPMTMRSEEHTSELQSRFDLVCRLLLEKKKPHT